MIQPEKARGVMLFFLVTALLPSASMSEPPGLNSDGEVFKLQGPKSTAVRRNGSATLPCRLLVAKPNLHDGVIKFVPFITTSINQLTVQWKIDGFGYTNDTLIDSFEGRYEMPGPINKGIFDLVIKFVQYSDEATFTCQVTINTFRTLEPTRIKTVTSETVRVSLFIPPNQMKVWRISNQMPSTSVGQWSKPASETRLQADIPSLGDSVVPFQHAYNASSDPTSQHRNWQLEEDPRRFASDNRSMQHGDALWAMDGENVTLECRSGKGKPAPRLIWVLGDGKDFNPLDGSPSLFPFQSDVGRDPSGRHYPRWRYIFEERDASRFGFLLNYSEIKTFDKMFSGSSTLTLTADKSLSGRRIECLVQNVAAFHRSILPKVGINLEIIYIHDVKITSDVSTGAELHENEDVSFHCSADANPGGLQYLWTMTDLGYMLMSPGESHASNDQRRFTSVNLESNEREVVAVGQGTPTIQLPITRSMHGQLLRCWVGVDSFNGKIILPPTFPIWRRHTIALSVLFPPVLEGLQHEIEALAMGESTQLTCAVDANPAVHVVWYQYVGIRLVSQKTLSQLPSNSSGFGYFDPSILTPSFLHSFRMMNLDSGSDFKKLKRDLRISRIVVTATSYDDFGLYVCVGGPHHPKSVRKISIVAESGPPKIQMNVRVFGRLGRKGQLACKVISLPRPRPEQILWSFNGHLLFPHDLLQIEHENSLTGAASYLRFTRLEETHFGAYNCTVITSQGFDSIVIDLVKSEEIPYAFAIGTGVAVVVAVLFAVIVFWMLRRQYREVEDKSPARIITTASCNELQTERMIAMNERFGTLKSTNGYIQAKCDNKNEPINTPGGEHSYSTLPRSPCLPPRHHMMQTDSRVDNFPTSQISPIESGGVFRVVMVSPEVNETSFSTLPNPFRFSPERGVEPICEFRTKLNPETRHVYVSEPRGDDIQSSFPSYIISENIWNKEEREEEEGESDEHKHPTTTMTFDLRSNLDASSHH